MARIRLKNLFFTPTHEDVTNLAHQLVLSTLRNSLSRKIIESLKNSPKWPFDIGREDADEIERVILDLWSTTESFMRSGRGKLEPSLANSFLDEMHSVAYERLAELGMPEQQMAELGRRSQQRYPEYETAYAEFCREYPNPNQLAQGGWMVKAFMPFSAVVTRSLFGRESSDVDAASTIIARVNEHFVVMAKELDDEAAHWTVARGLKGEKAE